MSKHDHNPHGIILTHQETEALRQELAGFVPELQDYGFTDRGAQKDPWQQMHKRHSDALAQHMAASRNRFIGLRDGMWARGEVKPDTPFAYGHPPRQPLPPPRMTDNELRRFGMATMVERVADRARRNEEDYKGR